MDPRLSELWLFKLQEKAQAWMEVVVGLGGCRIPSVAHLAPCLHHRSSPALGSPKAWGHAPAPTPPGPSDLMSCLSGPLSPCL